MTEVQSPPGVTLWLPGGGPARPEVPVGLPGSHSAAGLRLWASGAAGSRVHEIREGVAEIALRRLDEPLTLTATVPATDAVAWWRPGSTVPHSTIPPSWTQPVDITALQGIPIGALLTGKDTTRLVYALDAATSPTQVRAGLVEETAEFMVMVTVAGASASGEVRLYLDCSGDSFAKSVPGAGGWLQGETGARAAPGALDPVLCTWYFAHQAVTSDIVEAVADRAAELGFGTVIVDDGWQTTSHGRGYGSCGDWDVATEKFPDPAGMVGYLRARGMRTVWWVGTPFVGHRARARELGLATLYDEPDLEAEVLDPRDPATRAYLVGRVRDLVDRTTADGVKLDFLERFVDPPGEASSVVAAAAQAIEEIVAELRGLGVEPLIEFREPYVHPVPARSASMIRVGDCPLSPVQNRVGIIDLRLARPGTPIHSDPIMWAEADSPERVAYHLINALLGVPQISVDLRRLPADQGAVLAYWLGVWREQRDLLLHGELYPERPDLSYPLVRVRDGGRHFIARYAPLPVAIPDPEWTELLIANADDSRPILQNEADEVRAELEVRDAQGRLVAAETLVLPPGPTTVELCYGGFAKLRRIDAA